MNEVAGEPRFAMLETIREFAIELLVETGEAETIRQRHCLYYLELAEKANLDMRGPREASWLDRLDVEHENLRAALGSSIERNQSETALRLGAAMRLFWGVRGYWSEGRYWLELALAKPQRNLAKEPESTQLRANALYALGYLAWLQTDYVQEMASCEESLALCREIGDKRGIAMALNAIGATADTQDDYARATSLYNESLALSREVGDKRGIALTVDSVAALATRKGQWERAVRLFGAAQAFFEATQARRNPADQRDYEERLAIARAALSDTAYAALWAEGQVMTPERVISYALEEDGA